MTINQLITQLKKMPEKLRELPIWYIDVHAVDDELVFDCDPDNGIRVNGRINKDMSDGPPGEEMN